MRVAYLGPPGTFSEEAVRDALGDEAERVAGASVAEVIGELARGTVDLALVPFENSIEGSVRPTLDTLAFDAPPEVTIVGEHDLPIRHSLIARTQLSLEQIEVVLSHPQANAQCARFCRQELPAAEVRPAASTADAVRAIAESDQPWGALGPAGAARRYSCVVLRDGVEDHPDNVTRFIWLSGSGSQPAAGEAFRTTLVFSELGDDHPGALVDALRAFSERSVNLTRIESRPMRRGLGRYMFFIDLEGSTESAAVGEAIEALRRSAESVRVLGSYPVGGIPKP